MTAVLCIVACLPWTGACCHTACVMRQIGLSLVHLTATDITFSAGASQQFLGLTPLSVVAAD